MRVYWSRARQLWKLYPAGKCCAVQPGAEVEPAYITLCMLTNFLDRTYPLSTCTTQIT